MRRLLPVVAAVVVACAAATGSCAQQRQPPAAQVKPAGCPTGAGTPIKGLPSTSLPCLSGPGRVHVSAVHGRPEVINFWASWCGPCREEMPLLQRMHRRAGDSVLFLGVDVKDDKAKARSFLRRLGVTYPQVYDTLGGFPISLRWSGVPDTLVISASGRVVYRHAGPVTERGLARALTRAGATASASPHASASA